MNICIFSRGHISKLRGGVDRVTNTISTELEARGHNVYMISVCSPVGNDVLSKNQFILPSKDINSKINQDFVIDFYKRKNINIILNQSDLKAIFDLTIETHGTIPTVSYQHGDPKAIIKGIKDNWDEWRLKKGIKFWLQLPYYFLRLVYQYHNRKKYAILKHLEYYKKCDAIIFLSEKFKKSYTELTGIKKCDKLHFIGNPNTYTETNSINKKKENIVIFVGRLDFQKRVDRLLKVWKHLYKKHPDWQLQIIGDGPDKDFYEKYSMKLKLSNVCFIGQADPAPYYKKASIMCLTSSYEGFGMVITEAMQNNVIPIVYHSYESVTDIIENNTTGFLIEPFKTKNFADKLDELMNKTELMETIQQNIKNCDIKEKFNVKKITDQLENLFQKLNYASH